MSLSKTVILAKNLHNEKECRSIFLFSLISAYQADPRMGLLQ